MTPETSAKKQIRDWLALNQWFSFPILQGMGAHKGIADIIAIKNGMILFIEVKSEKGKQSENQIIFGNKITDYGGHYLVARSFEDVEYYLNKLRFGE